MGACNSWCRVIISFRSDAMSSSGFVWTFLSSPSLSVANNLHNVLCESKVDKSVTGSHCSRVAISFRLQAISISWSTLFEFAMSVIVVSAICKSSVDENMAGSRCNRVSTSFRSEDFSNSCATFLSSR